MFFHKYSTFCMKQNQESNCWWHDNLFCFNPIFSSQFSTAIIKYKRLFCCLQDPTSSAKLQILLYDHFTAFTQQLRTTLFYDSQFMSWIFQIGLLAWQSKCHLFCKIFANNAEWNIIALYIFSKSWNEIILNLYRCQADHDLPAQISRALIFTHFQHFYHAAAELREPTSWRDSPCPRVNFTLLGQETKCLKLFLIDGSDDIAHDRVPW